MIATVLRLLGIGERRRYRRRRGGEVRIRIGGEPVAVADWSPAGFRAGGLVSGPDPGAAVTGTVRIGRASGPFTAHVAAVFDDGSFGARFDEMDAAVLRALRKRHR